MSDYVNNKSLFQGNLLQGKKGLIMGVANNHSLAWGISLASTLQGADLAFTYQGEAIKKRIIPLAESVNSNLILPCDVTDNYSIKLIFDKIREKWGKIDFLVHSIGFSNKDELRGRYVDTTLENFLLTMHISCYSFVTVAKHAAEIMNEGGSILTLTYYGAEKVIPNYNVMGVAKAALEASVKYIAFDLGNKGIRVNAISSGPVKTLAASGIGGFNNFLKLSRDNTPLKRNVTLSDVGKSAVYLLSDLANGVTGEVIHVDNGYHIMGMNTPDE